MVGGGGGSVETCPVGDHMLENDLLGNEVSTELVVVTMTVHGLQSCQLIY